MEHQTLGQWVVWPIDPATQLIILKIVGFVYLIMLSYNLHENINIEYTSKPIIWENRSVNKEFQLIMQSASWTMKAKCKRCRPRDGLLRWQYFSSKIESNEFLVQTFIILNCAQFCWVIDCSLLTFDDYPGFQPKTTPE